MAVETTIIGFITYYGGDREYNEKVLKEINYDIWKFTDMFCFPKNSGPKGSDYIFFGASYAYLDFDEWLKNFEHILKKLKAYKVFVFIDKELDREFVIGYNLYDGLKKEKIDLGREDLFKSREFPMLFHIIKSLKNRSVKVNNVDDIWSEL